MIDMSIRKLEQMEILFITNSKQLFPSGDATSTVVKNVADELCRCGHSVTVLSLTPCQNTSEVKKCGQITVYNYYSHGSITIEQLYTELKARPINGIKILAKKIISRTEMKIIPTYRRLSLTPLWMREYRTALRRLFEQKKYDLCIVTLMQIEAVRSAMQLCPKETQLCIYQLDPYWNYQGYPQKYEKYRFKYEVELAQKSSFMLTTPQLYKINNEKMAGVFEHQIPVEFPMVKEASLPSDRYNDDMIHCVFVGSLYQHLRPPEPVIKILTRVKNMKIMYDFYGTGQDLIRRLPEYQKADNRIILHGSVSSEEAEKIKAKADYLINIDNTSTNLVPSKIFEYISTGKPIINFYFDDQTKTIEYLKKYPLCLNIKLHTSDTVNDIEALETFLTQKHDRIPFAQINNNYQEHTPQYAAQLINDLVK